MSLRLFPLINPTEILHRLIRNKEAVVATFVMLLMFFQVPLNKRWMADKKASAMYSEKKSSKEKQKKMSEAELRRNSSYGKIKRNRRETFCLVSERAMKCVPGDT